MPGAGNPADTSGTRRPPALGTELAGGALLLFSIGFLAGLGYLRWYGQLKIGVVIEGAERLWAILACAQIGAWVMVGTIAFGAARREVANVSWKELSVARRALLVLALLLAPSITALAIRVFVGSSAISVTAPPGITPTIGGLGLPAAIGSYLILTIVAGSILVIHAALQHRSANPLPATGQMQELIRFRAQLRRLLLGAMLLVSLSSASAVALNRSRDGELAVEFFWIHGGLYSALLALLYLPAHLTLVGAATSLAERMTSIGSEQQVSLDQQAERRKAIVKQIGLNLSGLPSWDAMLAILLPLATSVLGS